MKIAVAFLPKNGDLNVSVTVASKRPQVFVVGRRTQIASLCGLLVCVFTTWYGFTIISMTEQATAAPFLRRSIATATEPEKPQAGPPSTQPTQRSWLRQVLARVSEPKQPPSRVLPFDSSRTLSHGDKVVVWIGGDTLVAEVAGLPHESVLLRRGKSLERLYVLGDSSYAVIVNQQSHLVRERDIIATVDVAADLARN